MNQWFSVLDYKPADYGYYFVYIKKEGISAGIFDGDEWRRALLDGGVIDDSVIDVTHFLVPPPIPI